MNPPDRIILAGPKPPDHRSFGSRKVHISGSGEFPNDTFFGYTKFGLLQMITGMQNYFLPLILAITFTSLMQFASFQSAISSDWEEDSKSSTSSSSASGRTQGEDKPEAPRRIKRQTTPDNESSAEAASIEPFTGIGGGTNSTQTKAPLQGKIEKSGSKNGQHLKPLDAHADSSDTGDPLSGKALDNELRGMVNDGSLRGLSPTMGDLGEPLKGRAALEGGKGATLDPDEDDQELMVEWDRWHNRFLRAVQLGVQELVNNPDPEDYERPRVDPVTGNFTSRYPLGTGAAFSCQVTSDGQIKNLELIEPSGFPKYDRAVMRAVQQLAGTRILVFPKGSHRRTVIQPGRIKTATSNDFKYHHFGDVERIKGR